VRSTSVKVPRFLRGKSAALLASALALTLSACGESTDPGADDGTSQPVQAFSVTPEGMAAAKTATLRSSHKLPIVSGRTIQAGFSASAAAPPVDSPFDLTYFGGALLHAATAFNVYVNCPDGPAACWGSGQLTPATFLRDLNHDNFIRLMNEFIGSDAKGNFPVQELSTTATFSQPTTASIDDIVGIVFSASSFTGVTGYSAVYHIFLPQGTDMCFDAQTCYSPDNFDTFVFCAFHFSVDFDANTHVLFTVEPYQFVPGCAIPGQTPHGVIDATASTVSHEQMETMMDPDGDAWFNGLTGNEGSDLCSAIGSNELIGHHAYFIQKEYSNKVHGCTTQS
jgi:hypothetical protein